MDNGIIPIILLFVTILNAILKRLAKINDMYKYYQKILFCCCVGSDRDFNCATTRNIWDRSYTFNKVLDKTYAITGEEKKEFIKVYKEYCSWLLLNYIKKTNYFYKVFKDPFSFTNRKKWNITAFKELYDFHTEEIFFLAYTFCYFTINNYGDIVFIKSKYDSKYELIVAHKMRLSALQMMYILVSPNKIAKCNSSRKQKKWYDLIDLYHNGKQSIDYEKHIIDELNLIS